MFGGFEAHEAPEQSASDIMDSMTPQPDQMGSKEKVTTKEYTTHEILEEQNPGFKRVNPDKYPEAVQAAKSKIKKGEPSAETYTSKYNPKTKQMIIEPFVYGRGENGEDLLVKGKKYERKPNEEEQREINRQEKAEQERVEKEMDEEMKAHVETVLRKELGRNPTQLDSKAEMARKVISKNQKWLKERGGYGTWNEKGGKWVAINVGDGKIRVYEKS